MLASFLSSLGFVITGSLSKREPRNSVLSKTSRVLRRYRGDPVYADEHTTLIVNAD